MSELQHIEALLAIGDDTDPLEIQRLEDDGAPPAAVPSEEADEDSEEAAA
jgi:hypothetical protein